MRDDYEMTEEQRIQFELEKADKKKKKKKWPVIVGWSIIGLIALIILYFTVFANAQTTDKRKPVIYLYPEETTEVTVKLDFKGKLTSTYPAYENGWKVTAQPDGTLTDADSMANAWKSCRLRMTTGN